MNFIPCVKWVKRGVAKANPEKIALTSEELEGIIHRTQSDLQDLEDEENDDDDDEEEGVKPEPKKSSGTSVKKEPVSDEDEWEDMCEDVEQPTSSNAHVKEEPSLTKIKEEVEDPSLTKIKEEEDPMAKYGFDNYDDDDDEDVDALLGIGRIAVYASNDDDPFVTVKDADDRDSEEEDFEIHENDNLLLVGRVQEDVGILEVYVYNEEEGSEYVHHDILLPAYPLCLEWLGYDPGEDNRGNLLAMGTMSPIIDIWDIDVVDCLEPAFKLGKKAKKKSKHSGYGHKDAVLSLSWNQIAQTVLASGSADHTVLLWDLLSGQPVTSLTAFQEKVQTLAWHPFEQQTLLTGSCDKVARVFDCRAENAYRAWLVPGEVERVLWNAFSPFHFFVSTDEGFVYYIDARTSEPLWTLRAHDQAVTGLCLSSECEGCLTTTSLDKSLKVWDIQSGKPEFVHESTFKIGSIHCLDSCPDLPFVVAAGGDLRSGNLRIWNTQRASAVRKHFEDRPLVSPTTALALPDSTAASMETDSAVAAMDLMTLEAGSSEKAGKKKKKSKKKKKVNTTTV